MSAIFDNANQIELDRFPNISRSVSVGGSSRVQRNSPTFYYARAWLPPMYEEQYREISNELLSLQDGVGFLITTIPHMHTPFLGSYQAAGTTEPQVTSVAGRVVAMTGFSANAQNIFRAGDWIQFTGQRKVYQVVNDVNASAGGLATILLSTDVIETISAGATLTRGSDVMFRFLMESKPSPQTVPGVGGRPLYNWNNPFIFREVL